MPDVQLDDFATAVRAIFGSGEDPSAWPDPQSGTTREQR
jgi:hypothetical protein